MQIGEDNLRKIQFPGLPLAVYREIAAHLRQVEGVAVNLIGQSSQQFDYNQSQIAGLWIEYESAGSLSRERVKQILNYYQIHFSIPIRDLEIQQNLEN